MLLRERSSWFVGAIYNFSFWHKSIIHETNAISVYEILDVSQKHTIFCSKPQALSTSHLCRMNHPMHRRLSLRLGSNCTTLLVQHYYFLPRPLCSRNKAEINNVCTNKIVQFDPSLVYKVCQCRVEPNRNQK